MANNYTAVPHAYLDECADLSDEEFGRLMRALLRYSRDGETMELSGNERFFARRMMNQEDVNAAHYYSLSEKRREAGRLGAAARWHLSYLPNGSDGRNASTGQNSTEQYSTEQKNKEL